MQYKKLFTVGMHLPKILIENYIFENFLFLDYMIFGVPQTSFSKGKSLLMQSEIIFYLR